MAEDPSSDSEYSSGEVERLEENLKRYRDHAYLTLGIMPDPKYRRKKNAMKAKQKQKKDRAFDSFAEEAFQSGQMTITAKANCPCQEGCKADHGALYVAQTINRKNGLLVQVSVKEDFGSDPNWIPLLDARALGLDICEMEAPQDFSAFQGARYQITHHVEITLAGVADKSCRDMFLIAPDGYPVQAVTLGMQFIKRWGHAFQLFERAKGDEALLVVQNKKSQAENIAIEERRAEVERKGKELAERRQQLRPQNPAETSSSKRHTMEAPPHIAARVADCGRSFLALVEALNVSQQHANQVSPEAVKDEFDRFKIWAGNIAAHQKGRRSLEYRLRDSENLKTETHNLLVSLQEALDRAGAIVRGERTPWDELSDSDSETSDTELDEPMSGDDQIATELRQLHRKVRNFVTCLFRLSMAIRDPAPDIQSRAKTTIDKSYFEAYDFAHVDAKFPDAESFLRQRLGRAISARRKYLVYREEHCSQLSKGAENIGLEDSKTENTANSTETSSVRNPVGSCVIEDCDDALSQTSYATLVNATIRVPLLPKEGQNSEPFECPLCFTIVSIHNQIAWKQHIYHDLHPYCCTFNQCMTADRLYNSRDSWFKHEHQAHRSSFHCFCGTLLETRDDLLVHVRAAHPEIPSSMTQAVCQSSAKAANLETKANCPLCGRIMSLRALQKHLGHHQEQLALFALPQQLIKPKDQSEASHETPTESD